MPKKKDLTGQRFGRLVVLKEEVPRSSSYLKWICKCDCGTIKPIGAGDLMQGKIKSCGCLRNERVREVVGNNLAGQRFGRLTVIKQVESILEPSGQLRTAWECQCDCGNIVVVKTLNLKAGDTQSCGCYNTDILKNRKIDLTGQKFGKLTVLELDEETMKNRKERDTRAYWKCKCDCGSITTVSGYALRKGYTLSCGCIKSQGEEIIANILSQMDYIVKREYSFQDLKGARQKLRFDFALFKDNQLKFLIEFNGEQHYKPIEYFGGEEGFKQCQERDLKKQEYCRTHGIPLIIIPYIDKNKLNLKYMEEKLQ